MGKTFFDHDGIYSLVSVHGPEDLKTRPGHISINPPPADVRCEVCGRHIGELKPFGKAGDPLVGDFEGARLIKVFRPDGCLGQEELDIIYESSERSPDDPNVLITPDFDYYYGSDTSWECRDCIVLDNEEYFEKLGVGLLEE